MMVFTADTAEEMRQEAVRYLEFMADQHLNNSRVFTGKNIKDRELKISQALDSAARQIKQALILKKDQLTKEQA